MNAFALAMIQADVFGVRSRACCGPRRSSSGSSVVAAEAKAQQTPVKIVFLPILCILPALFVVIVGPGAIRIWESFIQT